jgi:hypothetical protein
MPTASVTTKSSEVADDSNERARIDTRKPLGDTGKFAPRLDLWYIGCPNVKQSVVQVLFHCHSRNQQIQGEVKEGSMRFDCWVQGQHGIV